MCIVNVTSAVSNGVFFLSTADVFRRMRVSRGTVRKYTLRLLQPQIHGPPEAAGAQMVPGNKQARQNATRL